MQTMDHIRALIPFNKCFKHMEYLQELTNIKQNVVM